METHFINPYDKAKYPNVYEGHEYAIKVLSGEIDVCIYVRGACQRYMDDLAKIEKGGCDFHFLPGKAERYLRLVQMFEHALGLWDTKKILYLPWQKFIFMNIMGFYSHITKFRRFRTAHVEIPRGNAKSTMASQMALFFIGLDPDAAGNNIECVATKRDQSKIIVEAAQIMGRKQESFLKSTGTKVRTHDILNKKTSSRMRALSSEKKGLDGLNGVLVICDELHAMEKKVFEVIDSGTSKRRDSLLLCITTAGYDVAGVGASQSAYAKRVALQEQEDDTFFAIVYTIDKDDDIWSPAIWKKANPNWGASVDPINFEAKIKKAASEHSNIANVQIKHLNIWISEANAYFDLSNWDNCADPNMSLDDFRGEKSYLALDIATKIDLAAQAAVIRRNDIFHVFTKAFLPEERVKKANQAIYDTAVKNGDIITTPGEVLHFPKYEEELLKTSSQLQVLGCLYDPWSATEFSQRMANDHHMEMIEFAMRTSNLSEATKKVQALILEGKLKHDGNPILKWCLSNVVAKEDAAGNVFPKKSHEKLKIDLAIALIMGIAGWVQQEQNESVYEKRDMLIL